MSLYFKPLNQALSKAFATPLSTTYTWFLLAKAFAIVSCIIVIAVLVPFCGLKQCCRSFMMLLSLKYSFSLPCIILSNILPGTSNKVYNLKGLKCFYFLFNNCFFEVCREIASRETCIKNIK